MYVWQNRRAIPKVCTDVAVCELVGLRFRDKGFGCRGGVGVHFPI